MNRVTNAIKKFVSDLDQPKHRRRSNAFKAEGAKCVADTMRHFSIIHIIATPQWLKDHSSEIPAGTDVLEATGAEMKQMSHLVTAPSVIAVYEIPSEPSFDISDNELVLALDTVQDPGNLGTIVRLADWFGVRKILCSQATADIYGPKAVMSTMGAISRVKLLYCDLEAELKTLSHRMPVFGCMLSGENIFSANLPEGGVVVLGNEGNGVSEQIQKMFTRSLTIPSYPPDVPTSESLNVAMATGIILSQFRSRLLNK